MGKPKDNVANVIRHELVIEFNCPEKREVVTQTILFPSIHESNHFEDWTYQYILVKCSLCDKVHTIEMP
ncbi:MAG TPA: hypothetical protein VK172_10390 [Lentimicrobium sp.]|nr:hypothetical protein [Lentimicrobium sp.]